VVIPASSVTSSVAVHRSLGRHGVRTIAVADDATAPAFRSRYCDETVRVEDAREDIVGYKDALLALAMRPDVRTVVPISAEDVYVLSRFRSEFAEHVATPWPSFDALRTVHDRERLFDVARDADVPVPDTRTLDDVTDWDRDRVVKSRYALMAEDYLSGGSPELRDTTSPIFLEAGEQPDVEAVRDAFDHQPHVQEHLTGPEYSLGVLYEDGEPVVETQKRIVRGVKYYHGPSVCHETVDHPELEALGRRLLEALDWHGPADVDVIQDPDTGEFKLLEVNPRFWATVQMEIHAGFDFPVYYWQLANGDHVDPVPSPREGITSQYLPGELSHLASVVTDDHPLRDRPALADTARDVASAILTHHRFDLLDLDDPRPFLTAVANLART